MAMGRRTDKGRTPGLWVAANELPRTGGHPFYQRLNAILDAHGFDDFVEAQCASFYATHGRPSLTPGTYFRLLLIGYFEGIDSERGIAWRTADSLALRGFLGLGLEETPPEHSTISRTRRLIDLETHRAVFTWILQVLATADLVKGKTIGIDATTLEANAALRSIVRRDSGETYQEFLTRLAQASGIETPTRADLARLDRKRPKKGRNTEWRHPHDPDARITKMKDGRTHLAHKAEHAVDLETGAIIGVTAQGADQGDTTTIADTVTAAAEVLEAVATATDDHTVVIDDVVADKGYHSNQVLVDLAALDLRTYIAEPDRGRRRWTKNPTARDAVRIVGASVARVAARCSAAGASGWNGRTRISTRPVGCGARTCAGTATSSSGCMSTSAASILDC
jgi:transposase